MSLTPEAVRNKQFTTIRLREGYDMGEVDHFLDQVEQELQRLIDENTALKAGASRDGSSGSGPSGPGGAASGSAAEGAGCRRRGRQRGSGHHGRRSASAVRILEKAANAADELVAEATEQAEKLLADATAQATELEQTARTNADRITNEAQGNASRMDSEAKARAESLDKETGERRVQLFGRLESERDELAHTVDELKQFEREYRTRLKAYFTEQLQTLDEGTFPTRLPPSSTQDRPRRRATRPEPRRSQEASSSAAVAAVVTTMAATEPRQAKVRQLTDTPARLHRSCQSRFASDAHGVTSTARFVPISSATMRSGASLVVGDSAR